MHQTLFYVPMKLFGIPLFGFGLLFWVIAAVVLWRLAYSLLVTKKMNDFWSDLMVGSAAAAIVVWIAPALNFGPGLPIRGYGLFLMLAIVCSAVFVIRRAKKRWNVTPELVLSIIIVQVVSGIIGARIFYVVEYWDNFILYDPMGNVQIAATLINIINLTQGGLMVFGSIITGSIVSLIYLWRKHLPLWGTMDLFAPALVLGIAIGRLGCFMNGCCFGGICDASPVGVVFPVASPPHVYQMEHGKASLGGFYLVLPGSEEAEGDTLFHVKKGEEGLMSSPKKGESIVIESVEPGSNSERAGLKPGMTILRAGILFPAGEEASQNEISRTPMVTPVGTRGFMSFLYDNGFPHDLPFLVLDVKETECGNAETDSQEDSSQPKITRIAFKPGPFEVRAVYPTQLFSTCCGIFLCFLLLAIEKRVLDPYFPKDGVLFALMLIFYSICRFLIEMVRIDESSFKGTGLSISQCVSLAVCLTGIVLLVIMSLQKGTYRYKGLFPISEKEG